MHRQRDEFDEVRVDVVTFLRPRGQRLALLQKQLREVFECARDHQPCVLELEALRYCPRKIERFGNGTEAYAYDSTRLALADRPGGRLECPGPRTMLHNAGMARNKRKRPLKAVLKLPDLEQSKSAVLNSLNPAARNVPTIMPFVFINGTARSHISVQECGVRRRRRTFRS